MQFSQHNTIIASTILSITAGTVLLMILMSNSMQGWAQSEPVYTIPDSVTPANEKEPQADKPDRNSMQLNTQPQTAPLLPAQNANSSANDQAESQTKIQNETSSIGSSVTYSYGSGGGGGGGSGGSDDSKPKPKPKPDDDPKPDPTPKPDDSKPKPKPKPDDNPHKNTPTRGLHGVNFIDHVLARSEGGAGKKAVQRGYVSELIAKAKQSDFNLFRVPVQWESYIDNKANFLTELDHLVKTANQNNIKVWIAFFQYDATSHWPSKVSTFGGGYPKFVISCYKPTSDYERDPEIRAFWNDLYLNKVRDSKNSCKRTLDVWTLHANFIIDIAKKVDKYPNVIGYEIINEPHVWKDADYENLGEMHTAIAKKLRKVTDKLVIFTRETTHGLEPDGTKYNRRADLEYKILPKDPAKNLMYAPHLYDLNDIEKHVSQWKEVKKKWASTGYDVKIGVGEWAPQPPQLKSPSVTQPNIDGFVSVWEREGWMHTYWAYGGFVFGEGNVLVKSSGDLTKAGNYYAESIDKHYGD